MRYRCVSTLLIGLASATFCLQAVAQQNDFANYELRDQFERERTVVEELLKTIVGLVEDAALQQSGSGISARLRGLSSRLVGADDQQPEGYLAATASTPLSADDLEQAQLVLKDAIDQIVDLRHELRVNGEDELAKQTSSIENQLVDALALIRKVRNTRQENPSSSKPERDSEWLRPGRYNDDATGDEAGHEGVATDDDPQRDPFDDVEWDDQAWDEADQDDWRTKEKKRWRRGSTFDPESALGAFVGEFGYGWPYRVVGVYRPIPAIRYNRVEGFVLGIRRLPISWDSYDRTRVYGHGGYAFGSNQWQYEIGAEARTGGHHITRAADLKVGGSYRRTTATNDLWKSSWAENSIAAFFFNYDFFDYYQVEGWSGYAALQLSQFIQITGGYRSEEYYSLQPEATWSLFRGKHFRSNPSVTEGRMNSVVVVAEGGQVRDYDWLPRGAAFRAEAEFGKGMGGVFDFNRFTGDGRLYVPFNRSSSLSLRVGGGSASGTVPYQKAFTLGGIGSVRSYAQNVFVGTRMLLANAEFAFIQDWLWDDFLLSGFVDAGWINKPGSNKFDFDDIFPAAGIGVGVLDRTLRLELAFPLKDLGGGRDPSLWIRVNPAF